MSCTSFHILLPFFETGGYLKALDYQRWKLNRPRRWLCQFFHMLHIILLDYLTPNVSLHSQACTSFFFQIILKFHWSSHQILMSFDPLLILRSLCLTPLYDQNFYNSRIKYDADLRDRDGKNMTNITKSSQLNHKRKKILPYLTFLFFLGFMPFNSLIFIQLYKFYK